MPEPLYTADEMRSAEEAYPGYPETASELMDRAGRAVADVLGDFHGSVTVVCGSGNNGGDGRVAARYLEQAGRDVRVVELKSDEHDLGSPGVVVDALFGTGFSGAPRADAAALIEAVNALGAPVVAVDVPSGVNASTGEVAGAAIDAEVTVAFHGEKLGLRVAPGSFHAGRIEVADIGLEPRDTAHLLVDSAILRQVPRRGANRPETKYSAGSVLVVGGSPGMTGAVCLAAEAAFRADAGYVAVAAPAESLPIVEMRLLEAVKRPLDEVWEAVERATALAIGPGLGRSDAAKKLVRQLLEETDLPAVVDADGLHELKPFRRDARTVLTPHSGELARLIDEESAWVDAHRLEAARRAVEEFGCVVLLKGNETIVAGPDGRALVVTGTPRLATAGTGDVLTGITGAFLAKGVPARIAAAAAAQAHADAARLVPSAAGLIASDVIARLPTALDASL
jgi:ADP-dependent NAD(P)H-hydrate dehydratase / NAD(P)H-hydrate epimerase